MDSLVTHRNAEGLQSLVYTCKAQSSSVYLDIQSHASMAIQSRLLSWVMVLSG
jgi:hypothetical protein